MKVGKIVVGRDEEDLRRYGERGTVFLGRKGVMNVLMDVNRPHIMGIFGKRGTGKSWTMGVIAEEIQLLPEDLRKKLSVIMIDTMGIFWSMKYPNREMTRLLKRWDLSPRGFDVKVFIPKGLRKEFEQKRIPFDAPYSFRPMDLNAEDWGLSFNIDLLSPVGTLLERVVRELEGNYSIEDMIKKVKEDEASDSETKQALINRLLATKAWGIFDIKGVELSEIVEQGRVSILDVSPYPWGVRCLILSLLIRKVMRERLISRREEEVKEIVELGEREMKIPMVWVMIDEAHQFLPDKGKTPATDALISYVREGREPGLSLVMATQRPGKLHETALSQCDLVLSHRITSREDVEALNRIMQTYLPLHIRKYLDELPRVAGAGILLDDNLEMLISLRVRPRLSWHVGGTPVILGEK